MKKEWLNPEMMELGVQSTKEGLDCEVENEDVKCIFPHEHVCSKCGKDFGHKWGSHESWWAHQLCCNGKPPVCPVS